MRLVAPLLALFLTPLSLFAGDDEPVLDAAVSALLETTFATPTDTAAADELYWSAARAHGEIDLLVDALAERHDDDARPEPERLAALQLAARLYRRDGERKAALDLFERAAELEPLPETRLAVARLLDQLGRTKEAAEAYRALLDEIGAAPEHESTASGLRLRLAMIELDDPPPAGDETGAARAGLAAFAAEEGRDQALRQRAAIVLALVGRPQEAIELFTVEGEGSARFRAEVRLAEWALAAEDHESAQEAAWRAHAAARLGRDRRYALAVLVEAYRAGDALAALLERFAAERALSEEARKVWIDLLRETGRVDEALALFRGSASSGDADPEQFTVDMRRELLEMCRESGREEVLLDAYRELIAAEPDRLEWPEGLARHLLERGDRAAAIEVWRPILDGPPVASVLMPAAAALDGLGLEQQALDCARRCVAAGDSIYEALLFQFALHRARGRFDAAEAVLEELDARAGPGDPARMQLSEAYEQLGKTERALEVLEGVRAARGVEGSAEDLEMHLAWLHGEVGDEELALERWRQLWQRVESVARRRYVEDRLMTIAARVGSLADVAIELEEKLLEGTADARESGLLVRLYTKANDPVSAAEVIEEYMKRTGGDPVKALQEKARVYLSCTDFANFQATIEELVELDEEGRGDYLRQLAMSHLEQGQPLKAREILVELKELEGGSDSAEFEAGVLALAGLRDEAIVAYRRGIAEHPDRIESYLLMGRLMKEAGELDWAVGIFQHLAETADKDDLFTIAIDGLLNLEAPSPVLEWARRLTLERMAGRDDKMYLYQLVSDLSEQLEAEDDMVRALEAALPIAGERRGPLLRELMDMTVAPARPVFVMGRRIQGDASKHLTFGRRLVALGELVPPQVYLDLGQAFLEQGEVKQAAKTFSLARGLPDYHAFQLQVAGAFERAGYLKEALRTYERVLVGRSTDAWLFAKVGEIHEQLGHDELARELYTRGVELVLSRRPVATVAETAAVGERVDWWSYWETKNVDAFEEHYPRLLTGLLATTASGPELDALFAAERAALDETLALVQMELERLATQAGDAPDETSGARMALPYFPRLFHRAAFFRRLAFAHGRVELAQALDLELLAAFPDDPELLPRLVQERLDWGRIAAARALIEAAERPDEQKAELRFLAGSGEAASNGLLEPARVVRLFLPLWADDRHDEAKDLLRRADLTAVRESDLQDVPALFNGALFLEDGDLGLTLARHWLRALVKHGGDRISLEYEARNVLGRCKRVLGAEEWRGLCQFVVSLAVDDPDKAGELINVVPWLQEDFEEPLIEPEQITELVAKQAEERVWGLGPLFQLLPVEERAPTLRVVWPKVAKTARPNFLLQLLMTFQEPLGAEFEEYLYESFVEAANELDADDFGSSYYVQRALENEELESDLPLRLAELLLEKAPGRKLQVRAARAIAYARLGREQESLAAATELLPLLIEPDAKEAPYEVTNAQRLLLDHFAKEHTDALVAGLDAYQEEHGDSPELALLRVEVVNRGDDAEAKVATCRAALEAHPDSKELARSLAYALRATGETRAMLAAYDRLLELDDEEYVKNQVAREWERVDACARALAVLRGEDEPEEGAQETSEPAEEKVAAATLQSVKKALEDEDVERARVDYRRVWRDLKADEDGFGFVIYYGFDPFQWPAEEREDEDARAREKRKGGLYSFDEVEPEEEETQSAFEVLAQEEFGADELARQLRTKTAAELERESKLIRGMASALVHEHGAAAARAELLAAVQEGTAGKVEFGLLLALLAADPDAAGPEERALLDDLMSTVNPRDRGQLRNLAAVQAELGAPRRASLLYRWTAATPAADPFDGRVMAFFDSASTEDLLDEAAEKLEGEDELDALESILAWTDPGDDAFYQRNEYETLVLKTWEEALGPQAALEHCRAICDEVHDTKKAIRRQSARFAAYLLARAGEHDAALSALAAGVCKIEPQDMPPDMRSWSGWGNASGFSHADLRRLVPADFTGWSDPAGWLVALTRALGEWVDADRLPRSYSVVPRALAALRLHELDASDAAREVLDALVALEGLGASERVWIADVLRRTGDDPRADAIERALFDAGRLVPARIPDFLAHLRERAGAETALEVGAPVAEWSPQPALFAELAAAARAQGDEERALAFELQAAGSEAARAALESWREEQAGR